MFTVIECWVNGTSPILLHRATEEALMGDTRGNTPGERADPREVCEKAIYRMADRQIAIPGGAFARMLREAGGSHKSKGSRKSLKYIVPAAVIILDDLCGFYLMDHKTRIMDFEIDGRPVTIPSTKGRIMRYRARLNEWSTRVRLRINTNILDTKTVHLLMDEGVVTIGIGDFRPEKGGPFGTSLISVWKKISESVTRIDGGSEAAPAGDERKPKGRPKRIKTDDDRRRIVGNSGDRLGGGNVAREEVRGNGRG